MIVLSKVFGVLSLLFTCFANYALPLPDRVLLRHNNILADHLTQVFLPLPPIVTICLIPKQTFPLRFYFVMSSLKPFSDFFPDYQRQLIGASEQYLRQLDRSLVYTTLIRRGVVLRAAGLRCVDFGQTQLETGVAFVEESGWTLLLLQERGQQLKEIIAFQLVFLF